MNVTKLVMIQNELVNSCASFDKTVLFQWLASILELLEVEIELLKFGLLWGVL